MKLLEDAWKYSQRSRAGHSQHDPPDLSLGDTLGMRGRAIERLPASAVDSLLPALGKEQAASEHGALRQVVPTSIIVRGMETIRFTVSNRRTR